MSDENVTIEGSSVGTRIVGRLLPHRDDAVAVWLKGRRDIMAPLSIGAYNAIDDLLDEYRLRADLGLSLTAEIPEGSS